uniref:Ubiquitin carboxyl-terminal hydrolase 34 n=1 Tax=Brugia timori TaxID=42155 RepID=A0A0R3QBP0_9BILA
LIRYSDHCSSMELRSFLSLLSFARIIGTPKKLSHFMEKKLQKLSLTKIKTMNYCEEEYGNPEQLFFDPFSFSCRVGLAFDYSFNNFCDRLSTVENIQSDEIMEKMLLEESHDNSFISEQHLEMNISDTLFDLLDDNWNSNANSWAYSFRKFFNIFTHNILNKNKNENNFDGIDDNDGLDEMIFDMKYTEGNDDSQRIEHSLQVTCESIDSNIFDIKMAMKILEKQYDISVIGTFYEKNVEIISHSYDVEENICYDCSNAPLLPDVIYELLD